VGHSSPQGKVHSHVNALDGIRGFAFLLVLAYHASGMCMVATRNLGEHLYYHLAAFGYCGVDLFFVLSGFLITGILVDSRGQNGYFRNFYMRRVLRIFPLFYLALVLFYTLLRPLFLGQVSYDWLSLHQLWFWGYAQNWLFALKPFPNPNLLSPFWSLAIEEQFYLFWPLVVFSLSAKWILRVSVLLVIFSFLIRIVAVVLLPTPEAQPFCYFSTISRFDGLATGAIIAVIIRKDTWMRRMEGLSGKYFWCFAVATAITFGTQLLFHTMLFLNTIGATTLAFTFGGVIFIAVTRTQDHRVVRFFSNRQLRYVGQISYGLYIFHFPVMILLAAWWQGLHLWAFRIPLVRQLGFVAVSGGVTLVGAMLSWYLFESRILELKKHFVAIPPDPS
jgi:peptidoglycan/LPS O-acetylase OafA/YrhL